MLGKPWSKPLTPKQERFVENFGNRMLGIGEASTEAGYSGSSEEINRLLRNPALMRRVLTLLQDQAVKWQVLVGKSKHVLLESMDAMTFTKVGDKVPDSRIRLEAARIVLLALKKDNGKLLEDTATQEDAASLSNVELARSIVGASKAPGAPESAEPS